MVFLANNTSDPTANPTGGTLVFSSAGVLKARTPDGTVTQIAPAAGGGTGPAVGSPYVPYHVGAWYANPLTVTSSSGGAGQASGRMFVQAPWQAPPGGLTVDKLDCYIAGAGDAAATVRLGVYQVTNQADPFAFADGSKYADLLADAGTVAANTTGQKVITLGSPLTVAAGIWFCLAGLDVFTTAFSRYRGIGPVGSGGPLGLEEAAVRSANSYGAVGWYQNSVGTGALPAAFLPTSSYGTIDAGVGFHRSA
jgi:hypothetical protein